MDLFHGYAIALRTSPASRDPGGLGAFHVTRLGFAAVDDVHRRVRLESTGHRGRRDDPRSRSGRAAARTTSATGPGTACSDSQPTSSAVV